MASSTRAFFSFISLSVAGADHELGHAARQLGDPLGQLLLVVVTGGLFQLLLNEGDPSLDVGPLAGAFDDDGVVLVDLDFLGAAEVLEGDVFELDAEVFEDGLAAGEHGDVFEHGLAAVAVAGGLDGGALERAAQLVDHQRRQGLAFDLFADDQDRLAGLHDLLEDRDEVLVGGDFLFVDEDVDVFELALHLLRVGDEVGAEIAAIELHALDELGVVSRVLPSSTVMTPSLPTLSMASAMMRPISSSLLAAMLATFSRSFLLLTGMDIFLSFSTMSSTAFSMPRFMSMGLTPLTTARRAFVEDRFGEGRWRWWLPSPATSEVFGGDLLDHLGAQCSRSGLRARSPWRR